MPNQPIYQPTMPEGLIIPEGYVVTDLDLLMLEILTEQIIPKC